MCVDIASFPKQLLIQFSEKYKQLFCAGQNYQITVPIDESYFWIGDCSYRFILNGGSAIIAPDGRYVAGPIFDKETILTAKIELAEIDKEQMALDVTGHYYRPDIFAFNVDRKRLR